MTVRELQSRMGSAEFEEWKAFYNVREAQRKAAQAARGG